MKVPIEEKVVKLLVPATPEAKPELVARRGFAFVWRGHEIFCAGGGTSGVWSLFLPETGCAILEPYRSDALLLILSLVGMPDPAAGLLDGLLTQLKEDFRAGKRDFKVVDVPAEMERRGRAPERN
jgi:hypothetical protein